MLATIIAILTIAVGAIFPRCETFAIELEAPRIAAVAALFVSGAEFRCLIR
jgi:hypothetical protein